MRQLIKTFGRSIEITRNEDEVVYIDGYAQNSCKNKIFNIIASVQPLTAEEVEMLPEGSDSKESIKLYTIERLHPRQGNPPKKGDFFTLNCFKYEIVSVEDHTSHKSISMFYYKCVGVKVSYDA